VKYFSPTTNVCIIRVARDQHNIAWGALTLLTSIEGGKYIPNVIHVSGECKVFLLQHFLSWSVGTIKHAQLAAIAHNRQVIARYRALAKTPCKAHLKISSCLIDDLGFE
jgi:ribonuclease P/MRP protein subunit POP5